MLISSIPLLLTAFTILTPFTPPTTSVKFDLMLSLENYISYLSSSSSPELIESFSSFVSQFAYLSLSLTSEKGSNKISYTLFYAASSSVSTISEEDIEGLKSVSGVYEASTYEETNQELNLEKGTLYGLELSNILISLDLSISFRLEELHLFILFFIGLNSSPSIQGSNSEVEVEVVLYVTEDVESITGLDEVEDEVDGMGGRDIYTERVNNVKVFHGLNDEEEILIGGWMISLFIISVGMVVIILIGGIYFVVGEGGRNKGYDALKGCDEEDEIKDICEVENRENEEINNE